MVNFGKHAKLNTAVRVPLFQSSNFKIVPLYTKNCNKKVDKCFYLFIKYTSKYFDKKLFIYLLEML